MRPQSFIVVTMWCTAIAACSKARKIDRACRFVFPVGVIVAVAISAVRAFAQA